MQASDWRPIETAPKDGTWIVALTQRYAHPICVRWETGTWVDWDYERVEALTHWCPLPPPPAQED